MKKVVLVIIVFLILINIYFSNKLNIKYPEDTFLAVLVDGQKQNNFPEKGNYDVKTNCNNTKAKWDYEDWKMIINNLNNNSKCAIVFKSTSPSIFAEYLKSLENTDQGNGKLINEVSTDFEITNAKDQTYYSNLVNNSDYSYNWNSSINAWNSTNNEHNSISTITFRPSTSGQVAFCFTIESEENYDGTKVYVDDILKFELTGYYDECAYFGNLTTANTIKVTYEKDGAASSGSDNIYFAIYDMNDFDQENVGFRYQGKDPNNWVWFNDEYWRVIGIFDDQTHGKTGQELVKIIKNSSISAIAWHKDNINNWTTSNLNLLLNNDYYNAVNQNISSNCYYVNSYDLIDSNCDFERDGILTEKYRNMIENVTWYLGGNSTSNINSIGFYNAERSGTTTNAYIGLMYLSDYGYSVLSTNCIRSTWLSSYDSAYCGSKSWLFGPTDVTITKFTSNNSDIFFIDKTGAALNYTSGVSYANRPTLYLKADVKKLAGNGSFDKPYILTE